ncbi:hypothetical protein [Bacillus phage vB_BceS-M2]|nr:hypothetical protein PBC5_045 [Bacillus phage PBC5]
MRTNYYEFNQHEYYAMVAVTVEDGQNPIEKSYEVYNENVGHDSPEGVKEEGEATWLSRDEAYAKYKRAVKRYEPDIRDFELKTRFRAFENDVVLICGSLT